MTVCFISKVDEEISYDIYINSIPHGSVNIKPNSKINVSLETDNQHFELSILPSKPSRKFEIINILKNIFILPLLYFLTAITWSSNLLSAYKDYNIKSGKTLIIKSEKNGKLFLCLKKSNHFEHKNHLIKLTINKFEHMQIEKHKFEFSNSLIDLKFQLYHLLMLYFLWFSPVLILFLFLILYGASINNTYFFTISLFIEFSFAVFFSIMVFLCYKNYNLYKIMLDKKSIRGHQKDRGRKIGDRKIGDGSLS